MKDLEQPGIAATVFRLRNGSLELSLSFSPDALAALTTEVGAGFVSIPRRGAEVGGILTGDMTQEGSEWRVAIDQITPLSIEYQYGPSWRLSATDRQKFQQLISERSQSGRLIGWYRSNTRPAHEPDEADRQIGQTVFAGPQRIFLFCEPSADGCIHARCIILLPHSVEVAFPFALGKFSRLEALFHARHDEPSEPAPVPARPVSLTHPLPVAAPVPFRTRPALISSNAKIAAAAALVMVSGLWYTRGHVLTATTARANAASMVPAPSPPPPPAAGLLLGLRADYQKDSLLIGWNRIAPEVISAASATFQISDGERTRTLNLSPRELQNGSIVYKPKADEISVELNVTSRAGATASQSIRIVGATVQPGSLANAVPSTVTRGSRIPASPKRFQPPPPASPAARREIATADAPPIGASADLAAGNLPPLPQALPKFTAARREFHPPEPIRSPQPVLPAGMRLPDYAYDRPPRIQVEVTIGADGTVTAARLTGESGAYAALIGPSALNTARMWRFRPATLGGEPIQSTMVLTFRYARPR